MASKTVVIDRRIGKKIEERTDKEIEYEKFKETIDKNWVRFKWFIK